MIAIHVQHFLDKKGQEYFAQWLKETANTLKKISGFISIRQLVNPDKKNECHLLLEFQSEILLEKWVTNDSHQMILEKLEPFKLKPFKSNKYNFDIIYSNE